MLLGLLGVTGYVRCYWVCYILHGLLGVKSMSVSLGLLGVTRSVGCYRVYRCYCVY